MERAGNVYVVAGPNGSGKTTFAGEFLPNYAKCPNFVNADLIAHGLSPFEPRIAAIKAGKLVLSRIHEFAGSGADFGFETTLSGRTHLNMFRRLKSSGYRVHIFFLWLPGVELSLLRIKDRVVDGGHNVPANDVRRRFTRSISNFFHTYRSLADTWMLFDNSGPVPVLAAKGNDGNSLIENTELYRKIAGGYQL
ncbi:MAG: Zeta toxin family protein [Elusimicrobiota bacterium]